MSRRRLNRTGTVREHRTGNRGVEVTLEVSVPCSHCRTGCALRRDGQILNLPEGEGVELQTGERVAVSVSADGLTGLSVCIFGPALCWLLVMAQPGFLALAALPAGTAGSVVVAALGLVGALQLGRLLTARYLTALDLKIAKAC